MAPLTSALAVLAAIAVAAGAPNTTLDSTTAEMSTGADSTIEATTTTLHRCETDSPCGPNSVCHELGDEHICVCKPGFAGSNSTDGDGCTRPSLSTFADKKGKIGMYVPRAWRMCRPFKLIAPHPSSHVSSAAAVHRFPGWSPWEMARTCMSVRAGASTVARQAFWIWPPKLRILSTVSTTTGEAVVA